MTEFISDFVADRRIYDLAHRLKPGAPVFPYHVPYTLTLNRRHGDPFPQPRSNESSFANELVVMSAHSGTHIDALGHFSRGGKVHGGRDASDIETAGGLSDLDAAQIDPIMCRGVLLDVAGHRGVACMEPAQAIDAAELRAIASSAQVELRPGDVVLVRTGWATRWQDPAAFNGNVAQTMSYGGSGAGWPGIDDSAAQLLLSAGVRAVGADTPVVEVIPSTGDSVHAMFLVDNRVYLIENLFLEELATSGVREFSFLAIPLPLAGATGSPIRPLAIV